MQIGDGIFTIGVAIDIDFATRPVGKSFELGAFGQSTSSRSAEPFSKLAQAESAAGAFCQTNQ